METVKFTSAPKPEPEPCYRPSTALDEFVRTRDLTCRAVGCDRRAMHADIDRTVPYPAGATHPGDLKCYCRIQLLLKTRTWLEGRPAARWHRRSWGNYAACGPDLD